MDSKGIVLLDRDMTFPKTPNKFKTIGTTTDSQINAGTYQIILSGLPERMFRLIIWKCNKEICAIREICVNSENPTQMRIWWIR